MRKILKACALVMALACIAQAGEIQNDIASQTTDVGAEILVLLGNLLSLF